ncbi:hypothetical protein AVEN_131448-1 [Araneus ventricosus]|uniref:Uncharacterized protein n=1 Tax=Araneus ventricosus TaxID=182803 RepID=A0A4Y2RQ57_ARAVE|nr:hypothetical protein AVEN_11811-1 [Araneus ventricosus]GBN77803.1 hypothetical protein AVEN_109413-1 [Araneus ventricosus]GBO27692.1 hypothetical protein AVEN_138054-1 [Araneus ventricosus]GBO27696.1 hypothetical protein AVEN_131448-1 [Araneus ventricosus]
MVLRVFTFHLYSSFFPPFLNTLPSEAREWLMNYLSVIRPQVGQITQPQSCAFLHGIDLMRTLLTGGLYRLTRGWSVKGYRTPLDPLGMRNVDSFNSTCQRFPKIISQKQD